MTAHFPHSLRTQGFTLDMLKRMSANEPMLHMYLCVLTTCHDSVHYQQMGEECGLIVSGI
jgi:hypothetical protein